MARRAEVQQRRDLPRQREGDSTWSSGPEYQVLDDTVFGSDPQPLHAAGSLYAIEEPGPKSLRPVGEFNRGRIVLQGWRIEHWLNGQRLLVWQWNLINHQPTVNDHLAKLVLAFDRVRLKRDDGLSVLIATPYEETDIQTAAATLAHFAADMEPAIGRSLDQVDGQ